MIRIFCFVLTLIWPQLGLANDWRALESPTAIVFMRHALAPGTGDPASFSLNDCATQRNLDDQGRAQALKIGNMLKERGYAFDGVWTSQWCRCRETAELLDLGAVEDVPSLNSFFQSRARGPEQGRATLERLANHANARLMLVTHQVNITALTGVFPQSGEIIVTELENGQLTVTGRVLIAP